MCIARLVTGRIPAARTSIKPAGRRGGLSVPWSPADLVGAKGYLVRGNCAFYPSDDHPIRELVTQGAALTITSAARYDFGSPGMQHWEVYAK